MNQLCKRATVVHVHLEREGRLFVRQVAQVGAVQLLGKAAGRNLRDHQGLGLLGKTLQQLHYLAQGHFMSDRAITVGPLLTSPFRGGNDFQSIKFAAVFLAK